MDSVIDPAFSLDPQYYGLHGPIYDITHSEKELQVSTAQTYADTSTIGYCSVQGCCKGLRKAYNKRYKLCPEHMKCPLFVDGVWHQFCQQCSRLQPLSEFKPSKRSCMSSLDKHNSNQRRKRQWKSEGASSGVTTQRNLNPSTKRMIFSAPSANGAGFQGLGTTPAYPVNDAPIDPSIASAATPNGRYTGGALQLPSADSPGLNLELDILDLILKWLDEDTNIGIF